MSNYPDMELASIGWLEATFPALEGDDTHRHVDTVTPPDLLEMLPFVRVTLVTGADDSITDTSVLDFDVFGPDRDSTLALAEGIRTALGRGGFRATPSAVFDRVLVEVKPRRLPWSDANVVRLGATYRISARK